MEHLENAIWILPAGDDPLTTWLDGQIASLCKRLVRRDPDIRRATDSMPEGFVVVVGCRENNPLIARAISVSAVEVGALGEEGYELRWEKEREILYIVGADRKGAVYGVFAFFETIGCRFEISEDCLPEPADSLPIPRTDVKGTTLASWRGIYFQYCFPTNSLMSLRDYESMFDQMAKMRLNTICYYYFPHEPFLDFSFRGERKLVGDISHPDSGYISYGRHFAGSYRVGDTRIGAELYGRKKIAPMEFQEVTSSDAALDTGKQFLQRLISLAAERGINTWVSFLPTFVPLNFAKYLLPMPRPHLHWSALVSATDPVLDEINKARLEAILENHPGLAGIFCGIPEGYYADDYRKTAMLTAAKRAEFDEAFQIHKELWGEHWNNNELVLENHIKRDICFTEVATRTLKIARSLSAEIGLGVMTICKAYLARYLDGQLPKDVVFADIESRSLWTKGGAPLYLFRPITGRKCVVVPRAVDDGSMAGLQCNLVLYDRDRYIHSAAENGTSGLLMQLTHIRGNEHNTGYLAAGMWDDTVHAPRFYAEFAKAHAPGAADKLTRFYEILDEADIFLGGRGQSNMPWNKVPAQIEILRAFRDHRTPFHSVPYGREFLDLCSERAAKYHEALDYLDRALTLISTVQPATESQQLFISHLKNRTLGYREHLQTLIRLSVIYSDLHQTFALLPEDLDGFRKRLAGISNACRDTENKAVMAARFFADAAQHATDLGVLWMIDSTMITGTEVLRRYVRNIESYFRGEEYWTDIGYDRLFGTCPYPSYGPGDIDSYGNVFEPG
jgi:hypothetical protein